MPVVGIPVQMLRERVLTQLSSEQLVEKLQQLGCDVEGYATLRRFGCGRCDNILEITETENPPVQCDRCGTDFREQPDLLGELGTSDVVRMELLAVRPDMFDPGGLARVLRGYLGEQQEPSTYALAAPALEVKVDPAMSRAESWRPYIACAVVRDVSLDDDMIKAIMKLQENLHWALGRDRKRASIGVYDLDTVAQGSFVYRSVGPDELRFCPLGFDPADPSSQLTPAEILERHPKGKSYARLLDRLERYPLLCDARGQVLSMPPIINSEPTRVTRATRNFFVDITGTDERLVERALNIVVTSLAELDRRVKDDNVVGGSLRIEPVTIRYPDRTRVTPDLGAQPMSLDGAQAARLIGVDLQAEDVAACLRRMGHAAQVASGEASQVEVGVPAYRNDIMHSVDLIEDVAIGYGYHNIVPSLVPTMTVGRERPAEHHNAIVRRAMTGLGYLEVLTLLLSSEQQQFDALRLEQRSDRVMIDNPISLDQTIMRVSLLPGLLDTFGVNTDHEMPQRIFEVGNICLVDNDCETGARLLRRLAGGVTGPRADYAEIRSACDAALREVGYILEVEAEQLPCFIDGRGARIFACRDDRRVPVGVMGEVHPAVLSHFKLVQPAALFEIDLGAL